MSNLAVLSLRNRALIALVTIVIAIFGGIALTSLKQELIPSIEFPQLAIVTTYPGASPEVVEGDVSTPIETAIQGVPGLESSSATSTTNASIVQASFTYGTDLATAEQKITQAINRIKSTLPDGLEPNVISANFDDFPVIQVAVTGYDDEQAIQAELEASVIPKLEEVDGVNQAQVVGGQGQRITITPDQAKLAAAGYSQQAIKDALDANGVLFPGGDITENDQTLTVQTGLKLTSVDDISALPLVPTDASQFAAASTTIADVATVAEATDPVTTISRVDGEPALTIAITKLPSANTVDVSRGIQDVLPDIKASLNGPAFTVVFDQAPYIQQSIDSLAQEGLLGLVFAVIIILIFLGSVRSTLVTAISIPTSVLVTFIGIQAFGYSLNILTLGALTIAIGRVVDDSIVVIENIRRHYVGDADKLTSIKRAVKEVATAVTASTITTVAVFLPIAFVGDVTGELFRPFAMTVTIAMVASLLVALTIVPVLAYWWLRPGKPLLDENGVEVDPESAAAPPSRLQRSYLPILRWTLKHSTVTLLIAVFVLVGTIAAVPLMKTNFLGDSGQNTFTMTQSIGAAPSLEAEDAASQQVEQTLMDIDGIDTIQVSIGSSGSALRDAFSGGGSGITYSITTSADVDQVVLRDEVQKAVDDLGDDAGEFTIAASGGGFGSTDVEVDVTASSQSDLQDATDAVVTSLSGEDGIGQVTSNLAASLPYIAVQVDRAKAAALGLSEVAVGALVSGTMQPQSIGTVEIDGTGLTVYLAASQTPASLEDLQQLTIPSATGAVQLQDIATVEQSQGPTSVTTERGQRTATVTVTPDTDNLNTASATVTTALDGVDLPDGATAAIGGVLTDQQSAFSQLGLAMLAAILIVYIVMVATFKSLRQPLLLLISVPFAATGAILLQIVTGVPLGVASLIGVLMLIGIVVTNAIVLVDLVNQYRIKGMSTHDATIAGGSRRLRPILMTALATIFALTPMALGITGHGGFISQPLAIVVIGGLISSTIMTLIVLPTLFNLVEGFRERRAARRAEKSGADTLVAEPEPALAGIASGGVVYGTRRERREHEAATATGAILVQRQAADDAEAQDAAHVADVAAGADAVTDGGPDAEVDDAPAQEQSPDLETSSAETDAAVEHAESDDAESDDADSEHAESDDAEAESTIEGDPEDQSYDGATPADDEAGDAQGALGAGDESLESEALAAEDHRGDDAETEAADEGEADAGQAEHGSSDADSVVAESEGADSKVDEPVVGESDGAESDGREGDVEPGDGPDGR